MPATDTTYWADCGWCLARGAAVATICPVAAPGSTPICSVCSVEQLEAVKAAAMRFCAGAL
jgi:hypothetical protein